MTKKNIITRIPLLILGIAIGIGLSIGIAKAQPVPLKERALKHHKLSVKELKEAKGSLALTNLKSKKELLASKQLLNLDVDKSLSAGLLQAHQDVLVKDSALTTSVKHSGLKVELNGKLKNAAELKQLRDKLDAPDLTA